MVPNFFHAIHKSQPNIPTIVISVSDAKNYTSFLFLEFK